VTTRTRRSARPAGGTGRGAPHAVSDSHDMPARLDVGAALREGGNRMRDSRRLDVLTWGLTPAWPKSAGIGHALVNALAGTVAKQPSFRGAWRAERRELVAEGSSFVARCLGRDYRQLSACLLATQSVAWRYNGSGRRRPLVRCPPRRSSAGRRVRDRHSVNVRFEEHATGVRAAALERSAPVRHSIRFRREEVAPEGSARDADAVACAEICARLRDREPRPDRVRCHGQGIPAPARYPPPRRTDTRTLSRAPPDAT